MSVNPQVKEALTNSPLWEISKMLMGRFLAMKKWKQMTPEEKEQWKKERHSFGPGPGQGAPGPRVHRGPHDGQGSK